MTAVPSSYGTVMIELHENGLVKVVQADDIIGIALDLLGNPDSRLWADSDGVLRFPHDGPEDYRYRPLGFAPAFGSGAGPARVLICERVR